MELFALPEPPPDPIISEVWPRVVEAFAIYGKKVRAKPGPERLRLIRMRLAEGYEPDELIAAIHGYLHAHGGPDRSFNDGSKSGDYFRPETIFKAQSMDDRVELGLNKGIWRPRRKANTQESRQAQWEADFQENKRLVLAERREREAAS